MAHRLAGWISLGSFEKWRTVGPDMVTLYYNLHFNRSLGPFWRRSALGFLWKEWCWSWNSSTLATSCEELTYWKRLWCWEGLGAGGEGDDSGWDGWMASLTRWTWVWVNSGSWWWTGRPGVLRFRVANSRTRLSDWSVLSWGDLCVHKLFEALIWINHSPKASQVAQW